MSTVTDSNPLGTEDPGRIEIWEVREPNGNPHWIELDRGSIDDQLYLLRHLRNWTINGSIGSALVRYHGPK